VVEVNKKYNMLSVRLNSGQVEAPNSRHRNALAFGAQDREFHGSKSGEYGQGTMCRNVQPYSGLGGREE
jgi:hypothetical protein